MNIWCWSCWIAIIADDFRVLYHGRAVLFGSFLNLLILSFSLLLPFEFVGSFIPFFYLAFFYELMNSGIQGDFPDFLIHSG
jgi:hypothetical protein